jgi:hypothetical protein
MTITELLHSVESEDVVGYLSSTVIRPPATLHVVTELMEHTPATLSFHLVNVQRLLGEVHMGANRVA